MTQGDPSPTAWHQRLHAALMPDYNRGATIYWWLVTPLGGLLLLACLLWVVLQTPLSILHVAVGLAFAIAAGLFPVRIPGTRVSLAAGEIAIFLILLLHGPAAAVVLAGAEAAVGSYRTSKRWTSRLGSPAMASLAMAMAAGLFEAGRAALGDAGMAGAASLLALALAIGLVYFVLSAMLIGGTARLRRNQHLFQLTDLLGAFRWAGLAYAGSAVFATLLYLVYLQAGPTVLWVTVPLIAMLLLVLHFFYLQQEAQEAMRAALADVARRDAATKAREAENAKRHAREMQMSARRFQGAFTHAVIGMLLLDLDCRVIETNEALARLLGRRPEDLMGTGFAALLHGDDRDAFVAALAKARDIDFESFEQEFRLVDARNRPRRVRAHCSFFSGPSAHGASSPGKPCLLLQFQWLDPAEGHGA